MPTYKNQKVVFIAAPQKFTITVRGLLPTTVHYPYFDRKKISSSDIKPVYGKLGDSLVSDANGQLTFEYYYDSGLPASASTYAYFQELRASVAGNKQLVVTNIDQSSLPDNYNDTSLSYAETTIGIEIYDASQSEFNTGFSEK